MSDLSKSKFAVPALALTTFGVVAGWCKLSSPKRQALAEPLAARAEENLELPRYSLHQDLAKVALPPAERETRWAWVTERQRMPEICDPRDEIPGPFGSERVDWKYYQKSHESGVEIYRFEDPNLSFDVDFLVRFDSEGNSWVHEYRIEEKGKSTLVNFHILDTNGLRQGEAHAYYRETGSCQIKSNYVDGALDGPCEHFDRNGNLIETWTYSRGVRVQAPALSNR